MSEGCPARARRPPPLRLLCLHGYQQNVGSFRARSGALRKALRGVAELLNVDAPHPVVAQAQSGETDGTGVAAPRAWRKTSRSPMTGEVLFFAVYKYIFYMLLSTLYQAVKAACMQMKYK